MKKILESIFILTILFLGCIHSGFCQNRNLEVVDKFIKTRGEFSSLSYILEWKNKIISSEDTLHYQAKVELVRNEYDSLFGGNLIIDFDTMWLGYDGKHIIKASVNQSTLTLVDPVKYPGTYILGTIYDDFIDHGFLTVSNGLKQFILDTMNSITFVDTVMDGSPCLGIFIGLSDDGASHNPAIFIAIDKNNYYTRMRTFSVSFQGNEQYTEWTYSNVRYHNEKIIDKLEADNLERFNTINNFQLDTTSNAVKRQFDFSTLHGKILTKDKNILMAEEKTPITILDFWYSACYPCIKSIPAVNQIARAYSDKQVVVYGVNMVDDEQKSKSRLDKFLVNNPMEYETIMVDAAQRSQIYVEGFPTLLILDKNYKVIYKDVGYNENLFEEVSEFLELKLK